MKILLICHYFPPEIGAPQARLSEMARVWAEEGHEVQVLTGFPNHPTGVIHDGYQGLHRTSEEHDGYKIERTWVYATPNEGIVKKTLGHLSFMISALALGWRRVSRPNLVVVSSPTFFSIFTAWCMAKRFRVPLVVEVRDLWPGIFIELGVLQNRALIWVLEKLELMAYRAASLVVVVTDGFKKDLINRGIPADKVVVITNGVDLDRFTPGPQNPAIRSTLGAKDNEVLVTYLGAHGISHGLISVVETAGLLKDHNVRFAFIGEGAAKQELLDQVNDRGLTNVRFHPGVPRDEVVDFLRSSDILLVPLRDIPLFRTFIPSKMFEYLAAGVPVIGSLEGESADILRRAGASVVPPENPNALAEAIGSLTRDPLSGARQAARGREFVEEHYDRRKLAEDYLTLLKGVAT